MFFLRDNSKALKQKGSYVLDVLPVIARLDIDEPKLGGILRLDCLAINPIRSSSRDQIIQAYYPKFGRRVENSGDCCTTKLLKPIYTM